MAINFRPIDDKKDKTKIVGSNVYATRIDREIMGKIGSANGSIANTVISNNIFCNTQSDDVFEYEDQFVKMGHIDLVHPVLNPFLAGRYASVWRIVLNIDLKLIKSIIHGEKFCMYNDDWSDLTMHTLEEGKVIPYDPERVIFGGNLLLHLLDRVTDNDVLARIKAYIMGTYVNPVLTQKERKQIAEGEKFLGTIVELTDEEKKIVLAGRYPERSVIWLYGNWGLDYTRNFGFTYERLVEIIRTLCNNDDYKLFAGNDNVEEDDDDEESVYAEKDNDAYQDGETVYGDTIVVEDDEQSIYDGAAGEADEKFSNSMADEDRDNFDRDTDDSESYIDEEVTADDIDQFDPIAVLERFRTKESREELKLQVTRTLYVLPYGMRPTIEDRPDELTVVYNEIVRQNRAFETLSVRSDITVADILKNYDLLVSRIELLMIGNKDLEKGQTKAYKPLSGLLKGKQGLVRQRMQGARIDNSARCVITQNPWLPLDTVGVPITILRKVATPLVIHWLKTRKKYDRKDKEFNFVIDNLVNYPNMSDEYARARYGMTYNEAVDLYFETGTRYGVIGRQPTLFYLSMQMFKIKPIEGDALQLSPLVVMPFNADFDGDQMHFSMPVTAQGDGEAKRIMKNTKNLHYPKNGKNTVVTRHEIIYGLWMVGRMSYSKPGKEWAAEISESAEQEGSTPTMIAEKAYEAVRQNSIHIYDKVIINGAHIPAGQLALTYAVYGRKYDKSKSRYYDIESLRSYLEEADSKVTLNKLVEEGLKHKKLSIFDTIRIDGKEGSFDTLVGYYWILMKSNDKTGVDAFIKGISDKGLAKAIQPIGEQKPLSVDKFAEAINRLVQLGFAVATVWPPNIATLTDDKLDSSINSNAERFKAAMIGDYNTSIGNNNNVGMYAMRYIHNVRMLVNNIRMQSKYGEDNAIKFILDTDINTFSIFNILQDGTVSVAGTLKECKGNIKECHNYLKLGIITKGDFIDRVLKYLEQVCNTIANSPSGSYTMKRGIDTNIDMMSIFDIKRNVKRIVDDFQRRMSEKEEMVNYGLELENTFSTVFSAEWAITQEKVTDVLTTNLDDENGYMLMMLSGGKGNKSNILQIFGLKGRIQKNSITAFNSIIAGSYSGQLTGLEGFISAYGSRKGIADKVLATAEPGYLSRKLEHTAATTIITNRDCGTSDGIRFTMEDIIPFIDASRVSPYGAYADYNAGMSEDEFWDLPETKTQFYALREYIKDILIGRTCVLPDGTQLYVKSEAEAKHVIAASWAYESEGKLTPIPSNGKRPEIIMRSPIHCNKPCCSVCYGYDLSYGSDLTYTDGSTRSAHDGPPIGTAVGFKAAQAIGEPGTQMTMNNFKAGGVVTSANLTSAFQLIEDYFELHNFRNKSKDKRGIIYYDAISPVEGYVKTQHFGNGAKRVFVVPNKNDGLEKSILPNDPAVIVYENTVLKDYVRRGESFQKLQGNLDMREVLRYRGYRKAASYLTLQLYDTFKTQDVNMKHFECIIAGMTCAKIRLIGNNPVEPNPMGFGKGSTFRNGDIITLNEAKWCLPSDSKLSWTLVGLKNLPKYKPDFCESFIMENMNTYIPKAIVMNPNDSMSNPITRISFGLHAGIGTDVTGFSDKEANNA